MTTLYRNITLLEEKYEKFENFVKDNGLDHTDLDILDNSDPNNRRYIPFEDISMTGGDYFFVLHQHDMIVMLYSVKINDGSFTLYDYYHNNNMEAFKYKGNDYIDTKDRIHKKDLVKYVSKYCNIKKLMYKI